MHNTTSAPSPSILTLNPASTGASENNDPHETLPIIVHSHLRWDFVWQRPQQILARLASHHRIAFIEEPQWADEEPRLHVSEPQHNIVRIVPVLRRGTCVEVDSQCATIQPMLKRAFDEHELLAKRFARVVHWFYSPMVAPPFLSKFDTAAVVYDCMDELANFRFAPPDLVQRELVLLGRADVVFTGGYQLYTRKSQHHRNVHFYGCGVEVEHYAKARSAATALPADVARLPGPVLGYFGVIDERLDYELIERLAREFSEGSVVMIGPVVKVDPAALPQRPNLHWLGQRDYQALPAYVKRFAACLMPFALNEATENINPTKTLEYMAAGKPVISTAVRDVVRNFTPIVQVGHTHDEFIALARAACEVSDPELIARGIERANAASWEAIVSAIRGHMLSAVRARAASTAGLVAV